MDWYVFLHQAILHACAHGGRSVLDTGCPWEDNALLISLDQTVLTIIGHGCGYKLVYIGQTLSNVRTHLSSEHLMQQCEHLYWIFSTISCTFAHMTLLYPDPRELFVLCFLEKKKHLTSIHTSSMISSVVNTFLCFKYSSADFENCGLQT